MKAGKARRIAFAAVLSALGAALLYLGSVLPTGRLALVAIASLLPAAAVMAGGVGLGFLTYAACALLAVLILPDKTCAVAYALVLGWYGPVKSLIERIDRLWLEWLIKIALFSAAAAVFYFAFSAMFSALIPAAKLPHPALVIPVLLAAFVLYDVAFTGLIGFYRRRIAGRLRF